MKRSLLIVGLLLFVAVFSMTLSNNNRLHAQSGCCKVRPTEETDWSRIDNSLEECTKLNEELDGKEENVFEKTGLVWWDVSC